MKRITAPRGRVATLLVLATLVVIGVVTVTASAATRHSAAPPSPTCSVTGVTGAWGQNYDGWTNNGGQQPISGVGRFAVDGQGNASGTQTSVLNFGAGPAVALTSTGTLSVNADCTGTLTANLYNQSSALVQTQVWAVVFVDNETEIRGTLAALYDARGSNIFYSSGTLNADKLFPPTGQ